MKLSTENTKVIKKYYKKLRIILISTLTLLTMLYLNHPYHFTSKTTITKLDLKPNLLIHEYYMVNNPPIGKNESITFFTNLYDSLKNDEYLFNDCIENYTMHFYEERWGFDRTYKPHYKKFQLFGKMDDITAKGGREIHNKDLLARIYLKSSKNNCNKCYIAPGFLLYKYNTGYYPNGFRNNPKKNLKYFEFEFKH